MCIIVILILILLILIVCYFNLKLLRPSGENPSEKEPLKKEYFRIIERKTYTDEQGRIYMDERLREGGREHFNKY